MTEAERTELKSAVAEVITEVKHHFGVLVEHLDSRIGVIAEGQMLLRQELAEVKSVVQGHTGMIERLQVEVAVLSQGQKELRRDVTDLRQDVTELRHEFAEFRAEVATEFKEVRAQIRLSYSELDQRLHNLEHEVVDLRGRIERIEARFLTS